MARTKTTKKKLPTKSSRKNPFNTTKYCPSRPYVKALKCKSEYTPIFDAFSIFAPRFMMPQETACSPASLGELFLPDTLLDGWVQSTNAYAQERLPAKRYKAVER